MDANTEICTCGACNWAVDEISLADDGKIDTTIHCNVCAREIILRVNPKNL